MNFHWQEGGVNNHKHFVGVVAGLTECNKVVDVFLSLFCAEEETQVNQSHP